MASAPRPRLHGCLLQLVEPRQQTSVVSAPASPGAAGARGNAPASAAVPAGRASREVARAVTEHEFGQARIVEAGLAPPDRPDRSRASASGAAGRRPAGSCRTGPGPRRPGRRPSRGANTSLQRPLSRRQRACDLGVAQCLLDVDAPPVRQLGPQRAQAGHHHRRLVEVHALERQAHDALGQSSQDVNRRSRSSAELSPGSRDGSCARSQASSSLRLVGCIASGHISARQPRSGANMPETCRKAWPRPAARVPSLEHLALVARSASAKSNSLAASRAAGARARSSRARPTARHARPRARCRWRAWRSPSLKLACRPASSAR